MARVVFDRVMETSPTTGAGVFTLAGAVDGYVTFTSVLANSDTVYYGIWNQGVPSEWEVGLGTFTTAGTTLTRTTVLAGSNGTSAVTFSGGTKNVWGDAPAVLFRKILQAFTTGSVLFADSSGNFAQDNTNFFWDDTNNRLGLGINAPGYILHTKSALGTLAGGIHIENTNTAQFNAAAFAMRGPAGTTRSTGFFHGNLNAGGTTSYFSISSFDAADSFLQTIATYDYNANVWTFAANGATALTLDATSNVVANNAAIATNASNGFLYIATCAGTPTGTPTAMTGRVPLVYDTTNHQFWIYEGGAWKQPKTPAGAATVTWQ